MHDVEFAAHLSEFGRRELPTVIAHDGFGRSEVTEYYPQVFYDGSCSCRFQPSRVDVFAVAVGDDQKRISFLRFSQVQMNSHPGPSWIRLWLK